MGGERPQRGEVRRHSHEAQRDVAAAGPRRLGRTTGGLRELRHLRQRPGDDGGTSRFAEAGHRPACKGARSRAHRGGYHASTLRRPAAVPTRSANRIGASADMPRPLPEAWAGAPGAHLGPEAGPSHSGQPTTRARHAGDRVLRLGRLTARGRAARGAAPSFASGHPLTNGTTSAIVVECTRAGQPLDVLAPQLPPHGAVFVERVS
jgi:hypothetical protein